MCSMSVACALSSQLHGRPHVSADYGPFIISLIGARACLLRGFSPRKMWQFATALCYRLCISGAGAVCFAHIPLTIEATICTKSRQKTCPRSTLTSTTIRLIS